MNKKIILFAAAVTIVGASILSASSVFAHSTIAERHPRSLIAQRLAEKFGLNQAEVEAVFDEVHAEREAQHKALYEERLNQLVTDGKITKAQRLLIVAKQAELEATRQTMMDNMLSKTPEERRAVMDAKRQTLDTWAQEHGIDPQYLMFKFKMRDPNGPGHHDMMLSTE